MNTMSKDCSITFDEIANMFTPKFSEVDLSLFAASEHEAIGLEHFLMEPKCNRNLVGVVDFETFHSQKFFDVEDFSGAIEYDETKHDCDVVCSNGAKEVREEKQESIEDMLNDNVFDGKTRLPTTGKEFGLDAKSADKVSILDNGPCKESYLGNVDLESLSPGFYERDYVAEISDMSSASVPALQFTHNQNSPMLDQMTVHELHEAFKSVFGRETLVTDKQWLKRRVLFGLRNQVESDNDLNHIKCGTTSYKTEDKTLCLSSSDSSRSATSSIKCVLGDETMSLDWHVERKGLAGFDDLQTTSMELSEIELCSHDGGDKALVTQKRLRKPPKRYIEESLEANSKYFKGKSGAVRPRKCLKEFGTSQLACEDKPFKGSCIQVPFGLPIEEGHMKINASYWDSENCRDDRISSPKQLVTEPSATASQDEISEDEHVSRSIVRKGSSRRKHHISWTPSEVMRLIEGVSQCGVGRWAEIKRLSFPSSSRRTSVDLKDKWRNLLRACCAQLQSKRKVKQGQKQAAHRVPESVLWRVRELATTYPYPRESNSTVAYTAPISSSFPAAIKNRYMEAKQCSPSAPRQYAHTLLEDLLI
ncbi:hypothetical protein I3760_13G115500 [Carya illinoinensis]|nr:hypothetical protein I3760_13G115500 [Carya illinoinensis]KAG2674003.1 hypothetical protein I3760_13G115500 [Carya illinoinensis]